ncbi:MULTISPECIES: DUF411 domain-containing protein [unclassified Anabaena]|uniref:DUF411 domain-containing protein n=1 Tax=unclassified Anabaena TaxID=2619674 RepID=UPI00082984DB|nr:MULTISPECIES: DUF411 domain-containing protein [unclassified Anabaena]
MNKRFSAWINQWSRYLLAVIVTTGVVATASVTFNVLSKEESVTASNHPQVLANNSTALLNVSVWDKQTESYSGVRDITVYRSPSCGCCGAWMEHIQKHGFNIKADIKTDDMEAIKQKYNLPQELASCHTAIIDGYVMEGHIPADDIKRFLKQKPEVAGLAVPGMPLGTPGMESGDRKQPFTIMTFDQSGAVAAFKEYQS